MADRQENIPVYREFVVAVTANGERVLNYTAEKIVIVELSGALTMAINDATESVVRAGIAYSMPDGIKFNRIRFRETAGGAASVTVALADGNIDDNRASFAGNQSVQNASIPNDELQVKTKAGTSLDVDLLAADAGLVALAAAINANIDVEIQAQTASLNTNIDAVELDVEALLASNSLRARYTPLGGSFFSSVGNSDTEADVVSSGGNANGILIKVACCAKRSGAFNSFFSAGTNQPFVGSIGYTTGPATNMWERCNNIFIPAGVALRYRGNGTGADVSAYCWYQVL